MESFIENWYVEENAFDMAKVLAYPNANSRWTIEWEKAYPAEELPGEFGVMEAVLLSKTHGKTGMQLIEYYHSNGEAARCSSRRCRERARYSGWKRRRLGQVKKSRHVRHLGLPPRRDRESRVHSVRIQLICLVK